MAEGEREEERVREGDMDVEGEVEVEAVLLPPCSHPPLAVPVTVTDFDSRGVTVTLAVVLPLAVMERVTEEETVGVTFTERVLLVEAEGLRVCTGVEEGERLVVEDELCDPLVVVDPEVDAVVETEGMGERETEALREAFLESEGEREGVIVPPLAPTPNPPAVVVRVEETLTETEEDNEVDWDDFKELEGRTLSVYPTLPL